MLNYEINKQCVLNLLTGWAVYNWLDPCMHKVSFIAGLFCNMYLIPYKKRAT